MSCEVIVTDFENCQRAGFTLKTCRAIHIFNYFDQVEVPFINRIASELIARGCDFITFYVSFYAILFENGTEHVVVNNTNYLSVHRAFNLHDVFDSIKEQILNKIGLQIESLVEKETATIDMTIVIV